MLNPRPLKGDDPAHRSFNPLRKWKNKGTSIHYFKGVDDNHFE
jgi:hypothetical protein